MSLAARNRALMHPRNRYKNPPDIAQLARRYPSLREFTAGNSVDWSNPQTSIEICRVLLLHDFGVVWKLPAHHLCPTVPSRLNYLLWVEDLLALRHSKPLATETLQSKEQTQTRVLGIDIGTGASCIYPLLGVVQMGWHFIATELDAASVQAAKENVSANALDEKIEVRQVQAPCTVSALDEPAVFGSTNADFADQGRLPLEQHQTTSTLRSRPQVLEHGIASLNSEETADSYPSFARADLTTQHPISLEVSRTTCATSTEPPLLHGVLHAKEQADFCMSNPPFYDTAEEPRQRAAPFSRCMGTRGEQYTPGGEVGFVERLIKDSIQLREQVLWYTSLVGRKSSLPPLMRVLRNTPDVAHIRTTEISQGVTSRWALAWTFSSHAVSSTSSDPVQMIFRVELPADDVQHRLREYLVTCGAELQNIDAEAHAARSGCMMAPILLMRGTLTDLDKFRSLCGRKQKPAEQPAQPAQSLQEALPAAAAAAEKEAVATSARSTLAFEVFLHESEPCEISRSTDAIGVGTDRAGHHCAGDSRWVQVCLCAGKGECVGAFWEFSERMRNDVVRDTRKWRRKALHLVAPTPG